MRLMFRDVRTNTTFARSGDMMLLVEFLDGQGNALVGDWCPKWDEVKKIVSAAVSTEAANRGRAVEMLRSVEQDLVGLLPELAVGREEAVIISYNRPEISALQVNPRTGWRDYPRFELACPVGQGILDMLVQGQIDVGFVLREGKAIDLRVRVWANPWVQHDRGEEVSASAISATDVVLGTGPNGQTCLMRRA